MGNTIYQAIPEYGEADKGGVIMVLDPERGTATELELRLDIRNHSPTGFAWGYMGSGPAQTALAILAHHLGDDDLAEQYYQRFKDQVIAGLNGRWTLTDDQVQAWLDLHQEAEP